ncbi:MAG TPA: hypothetical protein VMS31_12680 [Pyrinomonadaceae bacterium]|nr:hypothetical protein [Pyrinomonadaceae bacterium]
MTRTHFSYLSVSVFVALICFGCQPAPTNNSEVRSLAGAPAASPTQMPLPPWPAGFPKEMPSPVVSGNVPLGITVPADVQTSEQARPFFDYFSWESFIALNWPATGARGVPTNPTDPNAFIKAPNGTQVVWGSYKDSFDLFGQKNQRPSPWDSSDLPVNPCPNGQAGQKNLIFLTKGDTALMQTSQAFSAPLIDQRGNYVYYDVRYDQAQYNFIRGQDSDPTSWLYLVKNLAPKENQPVPLQMPSSTASPAVLGSIMVKASWRIYEPDKDDPTRFYMTTAQIYNPQSKTCTQKSVLLVGLHIAHKVNPFTAWVWSTFEQIDNVPPDAGVTPKPSAPPKGYSFNNGTDTPKTIGGFSYRPPAPSASPSSSPLVPVQVTRANPIPNTPAGASTLDLNAYYQQILKGTVWQYYQLVITQWPSNPGLNNFKLMQTGGIYPQGAGAAFPVNGATNSTMETYFQSQSDAAGAGGNSCMSCHYRAGQSDFSWGLNRRAY